MEKIELPRPEFRGRMSLEEAIARRRSVRSFEDKALEWEQLSQVLWAAQGVTGEVMGHGLRAAPSAGALYPIEVFVVDRGGVYHYLPREHTLEVVSGKDKREELCHASLSQDFIAQAPTSLVIAAVFERVERKYGQRGTRYTYAEAGHVSQNVYLQCEALGLATVTVGAFHDREVQGVLGLEQSHRPIYIMPIGYERKGL